MFKIKRTNNKQTNKQTKRKMKNTMNQTELKKKNTITSTNNTSNHTFHNTSTTNNTSNHTTISKKYFLPQSIFTLTSSTAYVLPIIPLIHLQSTFENLRWNKSRVQSFDEWWIQIVHLPLIHMLHCGVAVCDVGVADITMLDDIGLLLERCPPLQIVRLTSSSSSSSSSSSLSSSSNTKYHSHAADENPRHTNRIRSNIFFNSFLHSINNSKSTLEYLEFKDILFSHVQWKEITNCLRNCTQLKTFIIRNSKLSEKNIIDICTALQSIETIRHVTMANCDLKPPAIHAIRHLLDSFKQRTAEHQWISELRTSATSTKKTRQSLTNVMQSTSYGIRSLDISSNRLGDESIAALFHTLLDDINLEALLVYGNGIGSQSLNASEQLLRTNQHLHILYLALPTNEELNTRAHMQSPLMREQIRSLLISPSELGSVDKHAGVRIQHTINHDIGGLSYYFPYLKMNVPDARMVRGHSTSRQGVTTTKNSDSLTECARIWFMEHPLLHLLHDLTVSMSSSSEITARKKSTNTNGASIKRSSISPPRRSHRLKSWDSTSVDVGQAKKNVLEESFTNLTTMTNTKNDIPIDVLDDGDAMKEKEKIAKMIQGLLLDEILTQVSTLQRQIATITQHLIRPEDTLLKQKLFTIADEITTLSTPLLHANLPQRPLHPFESISSSNVNDSFTIHSPPPLRSRRSFGTPSLESDNNTNNNTTMDASLLNDESLRFFSPFRKTSTFLNDTFTHPSPSPASQHNTVAISTVPFTSSTTTSASTSITFTQFSQLISQLQNHASMISQLLDNCS
jgi:hypothetical protein